MDLQVYITCRFCEHLGKTGYIVLVASILNIKLISTNPYYD